MAEIDIEGLLRSTAAATVYPEAPEMRAAVQRRLSEPALTLNRSAFLPLGALSRPREREPLGAGLTTLSRLAIAGLMVAALAVAASLAIEPSREAIARFFGVQGSKIEVLPPEAFPTPTALPTVVGRPAVGYTPEPLAELVRRNVALPVPLGLIEAQTGFQPSLPAGAGQLEQSYVVRFGSDRVAVLEYSQFEIWEARLEGDANFGKGVSEAAILEQVLVGAEPAYWLAGGPHFVYYSDSRGIRIEPSVRLVEKNTLIWRTDHAFYRLETDLTLEEALRFAETLP